MDSFSWKRIFKVSGVVVLAALVVAGVYFIASIRQVKIAWASVVKDNRENFLTCNQLPFYPQVQKIFKGHQDIVNQLKNAGATTVEPELNKCLSDGGGFLFFKGDILIQYHTHVQRVAIEKILGDNFFGIPYRGNKL